jgi:hypothetical protein
VLPTPKPVVAMARVTARAALGCVASPAGLSCASAWYNQTLYAQLSAATAVVSAPAAPSVGYRLRKMYDCLSGPVGVAFPAASAATPPQSLDACYQKVARSGLKFFRYVPTAGATAPAQGTCHGGTACDKDLPVSGDRNYWSYELLPGAPPMGGVTTLQVSPLRPGTGLACWWNRRSNASGHYQPRAECATLTVVPNASGTHSGYRFPFVVAPPTAVLPLSTNGSFPIVGSTFFRTGCGTWAATRQQCHAAGGDPFSPLPRCLLGAFIPSPSP